MKRSHAAALVLLSVALSHALAPAIAWAQFKVQNAYDSLTVTGNLTVGGTTTTTGASSASAYTATSSSQFNCSKTDATCLLTGSAADATTSSTVGSITLKAGANINAADLVLDVQDSAASHVFTVTEAGSVTLPASQSIKIGSYFLSNDNGTGRWYFGSAAYTGDGALWLGSIVALGTGTALDLTTGGVISAQAKTRGTCTLNGASPAVCTATVAASAICTCSIVGATAAIAAKGCAVGLSGTTLTITSANAAGENVNYVCIY
jgi:hypothetical protein